MKIWVSKERSDGRKYWLYIDALNIWAVGKQKG